jgi:hypothetical protein
LFPFLDEVIIRLVIQHHFLQVILPGLNVPIFTAFFLGERRTVADKALSPYSTSKLVVENDMEVVLGV